MNVKLNLLVVVCLTFCGVGVAAAQDAAQTADHYAVLKRDVGTWDAKMTLWMPEMDEPVKAQGVETNRMLGGNWLVSEFKGEIFGQAFEGHGQIGYDATKEKYVGTWIDSMESSMSMMSGTWDYESQTMTMLSKGTNPETGGEMITKNVTVYEGDDSHLMTMFMKMEDGSWQKSMEIVYTRKK